MTLEDLVTPDGHPSSEDSETSTAEFASRDDYDLPDGDESEDEEGSSSRDDDDIRDDLRSRVSEDDLLAGDDEPEEEEDDEEEDEDEELENYFLGEDVDNY